mgnify:CR=1 FL=1
MKTLNFLETNINKNMTLLTIVDTFSQMCRLKINGEDEMFLFETTPITYNSKPMLLFSLVRQFSNGNDEPIQVHTDIIYNIDENIKKTLTSSWHENYGDFIQTVLFSKAFEICKNLRIEKLDIWADKT